MTDAWGQGEKTTEPLRLSIQGGGSDGRTRMMTDRVEELILWMFPMCVCFSSVLCLFCLCSPSLSSPFMATGSCYCEPTEEGGGSPSTVVKKPGCDNIRPKRLILNSVARNTRYHLLILNFLCTKRSHWWEVRAQRSTPSSPPSL